MSDPSAKIETVERLNKNLALLHPGSVVTLDMSTPAGQRGKFRSTFIGYLQKHYVLVQYPDSSKMGTFAKYLVFFITLSCSGKFLLLGII